MVRCGEAKQYSLLSCCMTSFEFKTLFSMKSTIHIERTFVGYLRIPPSILLAVVSWMHMLHSYTIFFTYLIQYIYNTLTHRKNNNTFKYEHTLYYYNNTTHKLTGAAAAGRSDTLCSTRFHGMPRDVLPCGWSWSLLYLFNIKWVVYSIVTHDTHHTHTSYWDRRTCMCIAQQNIHTK